MSGNDNQNSTTVGLLGVGLMGSAMARRLLAQGFAVTAWDRNADKARALETHGAQWAQRPADVLKGTGIVITMLPTVDAVLEVVEPLLEAWPTGTIWAQMSSVGASEADQLTWIAEAREITLVDALVSGSTRPAGEWSADHSRLGPPLGARRGHASLQRIGIEGPLGGGRRYGIALRSWPPTTGWSRASRRLRSRCNCATRWDSISGTSWSCSTADRWALHMPCRSWRRCDATSIRPASRSGSHLKDMQLVGEVADRASATMPVLSAVLERFTLANQELPDQDLAAVYEAPASPLRLRQARENDGPIMATIEQAARSSLVVTDTPAALAPGAPLAAAAQTMADARGRARQLRRVFERSMIPMALVDNGRRYLEANRAARLLLRMSLVELRRHRIDDFTTHEWMPALEASWRELDAGAAAQGLSELRLADGSRLPIVYHRLANLLPGKHLSIFAPARWPVDELGTLDRDDEPLAAGPLSRRER